MKKTTRWSCEQVCESLNDYVYKRLADVDDLAITKHVQGCIACQGTLRVEQRLIGASKEAIAAPEGFASSVLVAHKQELANDVLKRLFASYRVVCLDFARRTFADPFLQVHYKIRGVFGSVWEDLYGPLFGVPSLLWGEVMRVGRHVSGPLKQSIVKPMFGNG